MHEGKLLSFLLLESPNRKEKGVIEADEKQNSKGNNKCWPSKKVN